MTRRLVAAGVLASALLASLLTASPAAAREDDGQVTALSATAPTMNPGQTAWVSVVWTASKTVSNFAVTAAAPSGVTASYPAGRAFTSLYGSSNLAKRTQDFTAIKVSVPYSATASVQIPLTATWTYKGKTRSTNVTLTVPLVPYAGPDLSQVTESLTVDRTAPAWVQVSFRGAAPSLDAFRVTVVAPPGIEIVYPGDSTSSGLNGSTTLFGGLEDYTAFRVDATGAAPGTYSLQLTETYTRPDPVTNQGTLSLVVS